MASVRTPVFSRSQACSFLGMPSMPGSCGLRIGGIEKTLVKGRVAPYVYDTNERFSLCAGCGRIYWAWTHALKMAEAVKRLLHE